MTDRHMKQKTACESIKLCTCCTHMSSEHNCVDEQGMELQLLCFIPARGKENEVGMVFSSETLQELLTLTTTVHLSPHPCLPPVPSDMFLPPVLL